MWKVSIVLLDVKRNEFSDRCHRRRSAQNAYRYCSLPVHQPLLMARHSQSESPVTIQFPQALPADLPVMPQTLLAALPSQALSAALPVSYPARNQSWQQAVDASWRQPFLIGLTEVHGA
jgi:hypothetical protein